MGADWRPHAPFLTAGPCLLAVPQVYKGVWRGSSVAIKTLVLPARMSGAEKRERMVRERGCFAAWGFDSR